MTDAGLLAFYSEHSALIASIAERENGNRIATTSDDVSMAIWLAIFPSYKKLDDVDMLTEFAILAARTFLAKERLDFMHFMGACSCQSTQKV